MIIYLHGFDSTSPGNHEKIQQLSFIDNDVRFVTYSTIHPKHDMQHLLKEVDQLINNAQTNAPLICGVGLGGYWAERIGFLCGIKQVLFNPTLDPEQKMQGKIDRPEEYQDIETKCVEHFREKNSAQCMVILSRHDETQDNQVQAKRFAPFYSVTWDELQGHKFKKISQHLSAVKHFQHLT